MRRPWPGRWLVHHASLLAAVLLLALVFQLAQQRGGITWDEPVHLTGTEQQLAVVADWLGGGDLTYRDVSIDLAFYGLLPIAPAYLVRTVIEAANGTDATMAAYWMLHATAFACYLLSLVCFHRILLHLDVARANAVLGTVLLATYPLWIGYGFFNYKDVPTAAFSTLALLSAIGIVRADTDRAMLHAALGLAAATVLIGGVKLAALALIIPSWIAAFVVLLRGRQFAMLAGICVLTAIGLVAVTPIAWNDPVDFVVDAIALMSRHAWGGCTLTDGAYLCPQKPDWSAYTYLSEWFGAQLPVVVIVGVVTAVLLLLRRPRTPAWLVVASILLPVGLIVWRNSTLYDGLRHVLFVIPMFFVLAVYAFDRIGKLVGAPYLAPLVMAVQVALFAADNIGLFPFNYTYYNLIERRAIDHTNYETEYWGFSMRAAAELSNAAVGAGNEDLVYATPAHLTAPFLPGGSRFLPDPETVPPGATYRRVGSTRILGPGQNFRGPEDNCRDTKWVGRTLPFGGLDMRFAYAATCTNAAD